MDVDGIYEDGKRVSETVQKKNQKDIYNGRKQLGKD